MRTVVRVVLLAVVAAQAWLAVRDTRYDLARMRGLHAYAQGDIDVVREGFRDALAVADGDPLTWAWAGDAALYVFDYHTDGAKIDPELGRELVAEAWTAYANAVARSPSYAWSWIGMSAAATRAARLDRQIEAFDLGRISRLQDGLWDPTLAVARSTGEIALALDPSNYNALDALADVYSEGGQPDRAADLLRTSATLLPSPSLHSWGGRRKIPRPLYASILDALAAGIERAPVFERSMLHVDVGRFARLQGDLATALSAFAEAERTAMDDYRRYQARWELSSTAQQLGDYDRAISAALGVLDTGFAIDATRRRLAGLYDLVGRHEEACAEFRTMRFAGDEEESLRIRGSLACERAGDLAAAVRILEQGLRVPDRQETMARALLDLLLRSGRRNTARTRVDEWVRDYPDCVAFQEWSENL